MPTLDLMVSYFFNSLTSLLRQFWKDWTLVLTTEERFVSLKSTVLLLRGILYLCVDMIASHSTGFWLFLVHCFQIFIPELGMSFQVQHEKTRFFACQNPLNQGGGRKGLPKSFLNRFTQVRLNKYTLIIQKRIGETFLNIIHNLSKTAIEAAKNRRLKK